MKMNNREKPTMKELPRVDDPINSDEMLRLAEVQRTILAAMTVLERIDHVPQDLRDRIVDRINQLKI